MEIFRTGIILNVENFDDCVNFYKAVFNLEVMFEEQQGDFRLCCFEFGGSYLMIETGGAANSSGKPISQGAAKLRFNVADLDQAIDHLRSKGINANIQTFNWGSTINIFDPDGNRIGITEEVRFSNQFT